MQEVNDLPSVNEVKEVISDVEKRKKEIEAAIALPVKSMKGFMTKLGSKLIVDSMLLKRMHSLEYLELQIEGLKKCTANCTGGGLKAFLY